MEELFNNKLFTYPLKAETSYITSLENTFKEFERFIEVIDSKDDCFKSIKDEYPNVLKLNNGIVNCIKNYLWGKPHESTNLFRELIESEFVASKLLNSYEAIDFTESENDKKMFRVRASDVNLGHREEIFHIPLSDRHNVANQRFSIEGLPCLYLGSSIYVCWLELNRPNLSNTYIAGYKPKGKFKVFDLSYSLQQIYTDYSKEVITFEEFKNKLLILPLIFACSFQVKYPESPFKEEYIFPKLILEWIIYKNDKIIGLKYQSTKVSNYVENNDYYINYVFPPKDIKEDKKFCNDLVENFELTSPISWDLLNILPENELNVGGITTEAENIEDVFSKNYKFTKFGSIEQNIFDMKFRQVENN